MAERQQQKMLAKISELEGVNIGEKRWETAGEISSKQRPLNSLLESSLDYQHAGKVKPVRLPDPCCLALWVGSVMTIVCPNGAPVVGTPCLWTFYYDGI